MSGRISPVLWVVASVLLALLLPTGVRAEDATFQVPAPLPLAPAPGTDLGPVMAISPEGQAWVAWKHIAPDGSQAELLLASSPDWAPKAVAPLDPQRLSQTKLALRAEAGVTLAWSQPVTESQELHQQTWLLAAQPEPRNWPLPLNAHWALDSHGLWHAAWVEKGAIQTATNASPLTITLPISPTAVLTDLVLAVDSQGVLHLAWTLQTRANEPLGVYYAPVISDTQPVQVAPEGQAPSLILGPTGRAHLFWIDKDGLKVAHSTDWTKASLVAPGFGVENQVALAVGPDEGIHLVWTDGETLWRAHSADWSSSLQRLPTPAVPRDPAIAVDRSGRLHVTWASQNPEDERESDLAYLRPLPHTLQAAVIHPQEGDVLVADSQARAMVNGPAEDILRIEFYLQARAGAEPKRGPDTAPLRSLGIDRDGHDGWSAPLRVGALEPWLGFRVMALAVGVDGAITRAWGGLFTVQRPDLPAIWFQPLDIVAGPGDGSLSALLASQRTPFRRLDLYLAPATCVITSTIQEPTCPPPGSYYLGSYNPSPRGLWPTEAWQQFTYDREHIPDGSYRPLAVGIDALGNRVCERSRHLVNIEDAMAPRIQVTAPSAGAVIQGELNISAEASDENGTVQHVDFYLERPDASLRSPAGAAPGLSGPDLLWLGTDSDGRDGWGFSMAVRPAMDGNGWRVQAIAFDNQGLSSVAHSAGTVDILGRPRPYMATLLPSAGSRLRGVQPISLFVTEGLEYLSRAELYVENGDGPWMYLGAMADADDRLTYEWNTRDWPDGRYTLLVVAQHTDGHHSWLRRSDLTVQNGSSFYLFRYPAAGQVLSGTVSLRVDGNPSALPLQEARFYARRPGAELIPVAYALAGAVPKDQLTALWYTNTVLDGDYDLVAVLVDAQGNESRATSQVTVRNATPFVAFGAMQFEPAWLGSRRVSWQAVSPLGKPLSVTVEYSPDDGAHWLTLAREITSTKAFTWTTDAYPDTIRGRLRLSATDGALAGQAVSPSFAVNNNNQPPHVTLLGPSSARSYAGVVVIAWKASDPDDDKLSINLSYRRGAGEWVSLAQGVANLGPFAWDTRGLAPGDDYEVRVTATDARSLTATASAQGVRLAGNRPPEVLLMWPHGGTRLDKEAIILWRATDPDNDELRVDLYFSDNAGQTWIPLAEDVPNTGYYQWQVSFLPLGTQYRVRVVARDRFFEVEDRSKGDFSVGRQIPPTIRLLDPPAGAEVQGIQEVRWSRSNGSPDEAQVTILARRLPQAGNGAQGWVPLAENIPDDGFYLWNTRAMADGQYDLQVAIQEGQSQATSTLVQPVRVNNESNHPPRVALQAPQGGELWSGWREILWQAWDDDRNPITATLSIRDDAGQDWTSIVTLDARIGRVLWDTRSVASAESYWVRIAVTDGPSTTQVTSAAPVHIANGPGYPPSVILIGSQSPRSTERRGPVPWVAEDVDGDVLTMDLSVSDDGGLSWRKIAANLFNAGQYTLDEGALPLGPYRLRLRADDGIYQVESFATPPLASPPSGAPSLVLLSPHGGERWSGEQAIRWQIEPANDPEAAIDIEWSSDGGQTFASLASGLKGASSYLWNTRALPNGVYFLRLVVRTAQGTSTVVSEPFTVDNRGNNRPVISLLSPHGTETWWGTREVRWQATDADADPLMISLFYSVDRGATWVAMALPSSNTGSYIWDTTTVPNTDEVWLRATASDGRSTVEDTSDGPLAIYNQHAPTIALLSPLGGEQWAGSCRVAWLATQEGARTVQVAVQVSLDAGATWQTLAEGLPVQGSYLWDTSALANQSRALVRVRAIDGPHSAIDMAPQAIVLRNHPQPGIPFFVP